MVSCLFLGVNWSPMLLTSGHLLTNEIRKIGIGRKIGRTPLLKHKKTWKKHVNTHNKRMIMRNDFAHYFHFIWTTN